MHLDVRNQPDAMRDYLLCMENGEKHSREVMQETLAEIIDNRLLTPWFQPIVDLANGSIIGYEALVRGPSDSALHSPGNLFNVAMQTNRLIDLEMLCRDVNIEGFSRLKLAGKLFLNISPRALLEPGFPNGFTICKLQQYGIDPQDVVIELTENFPILDTSVVCNALSHYRNAGFKVALDDLGSAYAGLRLWAELKPDYVKFDKYFIQSINRDKSKKRLVKSLQEIAVNDGCQTIAEGVETLEEYYVVQSLGVTLGQGYYFSRPSASPPQQIPANILMAPKDKQLYARLKWRSETVEHLITTVPTLTPETSLKVVGDLLERMPELLAIPVVDRDKICGMVHRYQVMNILASRYGRDLRGNSPITEIMQESPLCIDKDMPIEKLSQMITNDNTCQTSNQFVITANGIYAGVGLVTDLLKKITDLQIRNARYANPLTQLPGNVPINEHIANLLHDHTSFTSCYFDLDNFKPFNDLYGYGRGDMVILLLSEILQNMCNPECDFIGHVGGDDFIVVFRSEDWKKRCHAMLDDFARQVVDLYDEEHRLAGGIDAKDRRGANTFFPIASVSVGATFYDGHCSVCTQHDIAYLSSEAKKQAKKIVGNSLFVNRRQCNQID
ncbi:MAG: GGDEF domain-containing protein [Desulfuromonas sp.]|nr:GGDEF domain-containing protein [Desulfuromonas sp.]